VTDEIRLDGENLADHTVRVTTAHIAAARLTAWVHGVHAERPTRAELREDVAALLGERLGLLADDRPSPAEFEALKTNYHRQTAVIGDLIAERDEARRERDELLGHLPVRTRDDYLLLRLSGDRPELLDVDAVGGIGNRVSIWAHDRGGVK
jgi:hypothetical protein